MGFFSAKDGTRLFYQDWGTGEPVVFLHSWLLHSDAWEYQFHILVEAGLRCIAHDRRGHGRSDTPGRGYDYDTLADDLSVLLAILDLHNATLVGHSMGGGEIVRYLSRHGRTRVGRIAFVGASLPALCATPDNPGAMDPLVYQAFVHGVRSDRPGFFAAWGQAFFATHLGNRVSSEAVTAMLQQAQLTSPLAALACWSSVFYADFRAELKRLDVPTLIVHGTGDANCPVEMTGRRTATLVPHAQYKEYVNAGHGLFLTHADQLSSDLLAFVKS